ncbi:MAG TPA: glycosyltransferase, partial [Coxiellaceae bacterium]|nr:glycosyltransferase [Coxiellaceae bacterium]
MFKYPIIRLVRLEDTPYGGAENYLRRLSAVLTQRQIAHEALHSKAPRWLASWIRILWFNYQTKRWKKDQFYFSLARITCPDIYRAGDGVHRVYMKIKGATWWPNPLHFIYCMLEKRCFEHAKKIIANSQMVKQQIIETYHTAPEKISVVYNGIDWPTVDETTRRKVLRASLYIPLDKKVILFAGCDFRRKGLDSF